MNLLKKNRCLISSICKSKMTTPEFSIVPSAQQNKEWRKNADWYSTGKSNECEKYQIGALQQVLFPKLLSKTNDRIHTENLEIIDCRCPLKQQDGYEYTENFDGVVQTGSNMFYFNMKFVCDAGGAQTRTLREVYHFIRLQMEHLLLLLRDNDIQPQNLPYFINLLDGDTCWKSAKYFDYLVQKEKYRGILENIFVGDLHTFQNSGWVEKITQ